MHRKAPAIGLYSILVAFTLILYWFCNARQSMFLDQIEDSNMELALNFAYAAYVKEWDGSAERFDHDFREEDGSYHLRNQTLHSSEALNRLGRTGWNLYFNEIGVSSQQKQDAQILTGSKIQADHQITFVVAFRGSDKLEDYLFTNLKNEPTALSGIESSQHWLQKTRIRKIIEQFFAITGTAMVFNTLVVWFSNIFPASPILVHLGYVEQVSYALSAKIVDPVDGAYLTILEALKKYPSADFIITGHSSGGGDAHVLSVLVWQMGLNHHKRIHTRTFAAAGAFNHAGQEKYKELDNINYFISGDPIMFVNDVSGYGPIGVNVILPASPIDAKYTRAIHDVEAYKNQLTTRK
jgi:hypothetical protein